MKDPLPFFTLQDYCNKETGICERCEDGEYLSSGTSGSDANTFVRISQERLKQNRPCRVTQEIRDESVPGGFRLIRVVWEPLKFQLKPELVHFTDQDEKALQQQAEAEAEIEDRLAKGLPIDGPSDEELAEALAAQGRWL